MKTETNSNDINVDNHIEDILASMTGYLLGASNEPLLETITTAVKESMTNRNTSLVINTELLNTCVFQEVIDTMVVVGHDRDEIFTLKMRNGFRQITLTSKDSDVTYIKVPSADLNRNNKGNNRDDAVLSLIKSKANLTQENIAELLNTTQPTISKCVKRLRIEGKI